MIKRMMIAAALLVAPVSAQAADDFCGALGDFAAAALTGRHNGTAMSAQVAKVNAKIKDPDLRGIMFDVLAEAYKLPILKAPLAREEAVAEFRNRWEVACYEATADYI